MWLNNDPLAEKFPSWSPYAYALNNPMKFIDPDGSKPKDIRFRIRSGNKNEDYKYQNGKFYNT